MRDRIDPRKEAFADKPTAGWHDLPHALLFVGSLDPTRDQRRAYAAKLSENGVSNFLIEAHGKVHASFCHQAVLPSAQADIDQSRAALKAMLNLGNS